MTKPRGLRRMAAVTAVSVLVGTGAVVASGPASASGPKPRNVCELTFKNDSISRGELGESQLGPDERWTRRPTGDLRPGASVTFSAEDWPPPGPCRITVHYTFVDLRSSQRIPAQGLIVFDGKEGDAQCTVFGEGLECSTDKHRDESTFSVEVTFTQ